MPASSTDTRGGPAGVAAPVAGRGIPATLLLALGAGIIGLLALHLTHGSVPIPAGEVLSALWRGEPDIARTVVVDLRLPRALLALITGASLGAATVLLQATTRTGLADPTLLGMAGAATLAAVAVEPEWRVPIGAYAALMAALLVDRLGAERSPERRALAGMALAAATLAGLAITLAFASNLATANIIGWIVGSFYGRSWADLLTASLVAVPALFLAVRAARAANLLVLGEDVAQNLGVQVRFSTLWLLVLAALLAGVASASAGLLALGGFATAFIARAAVGTDHARLIPAAIAIGALLLGGGDLLGRVILLPFELPAGALVTTAGAIALIIYVRTGS